MQPYVEPLDQTSHAPRHIDWVNTLCRCSHATADLTFAWRDGTPIIDLDNPADDNDDSDYEHSKHSNDLDNDNDSDVIDAKEHRKVVTCDIPGAFMQVDIDKVIHV